MRRTFLIQYTSPVSHIEERRTQKTGREELLKFIRRLLYYAFHQSRLRCLVTINFLRHSFVCALKSGSLLLLLLLLYVCLRLAILRQSRDGVRSRGMK